MLPTRASSSVVEQVSYTHHVGGSIPPWPTFMDSLTVRQATLKDFSAFYPVFKTCLQTLFPEYSPHSIAFFTDVPYEKSSLKSQIKNKEKILMLALDGTSVVGFFLVQKHYYGVSMATWLAVLPEYQKHGLASKLITLWEEITSDQGGHALMVWTNDKNVPFYKNRGFILSGKFPKAWYGINVNLLYKGFREPDEKNYLQEYLAKRKEKKR